MRFRFALPLCLAALCSAASPNGAKYVGAQVCAGCHKDIAATQTSTAMALTWQGAVTSLLPANDDEKASDSGLTWEIRRQGKQFVYSAPVPGGGQIEAPVEGITGGKRHGLSFFARLSQVHEIPLVRPTLIETRYMHSSLAHGLAVSPGFPAGAPKSLETALGRVLSPTFETKCLTCHGLPNTLGAGAEGGVHCESCHGPGSAHLQAVAKGRPGEGMVNLKRLSPERSLAVCAPCHSGFSDQYDPVPDDLLISNQVNALRHADCFIQSGEGITCVSCHDPHKSVTSDPRPYVNACLNCHSEQAKPHAAICPVNAKQGCIGCHMPKVVMGPYHVTDHWIRVHTEQGAAAAKSAKASGSQIRPRRLFLRIIVTNDRAKADEAASRLASGDAFFDVARQYSVDQTAPGGGFLGETRLDQMDPALAQAAAALGYGEVSPVVSTRPDRFIILQRLPRDFREQATRLTFAGDDYHTRGDLKEAAQRYEAALRVYPQSRRALIAFGSINGEMGDVARAVGILRLAAQLYPQDAAAEYNLGIALGAAGLGKEELAAYRKAIDLDPDLTVAYENLGGSLFTAGQAAEAIEVYRQGLNVDPLAAVLAYNLSIALEHTGDAAGAQHFLDLANALDPEFVHKQTK